MRLLVSGLLFLLLFAGLFSSVSVFRVEAAGTIYIRADGSVDPPTAPIQRNGDLYTFTDNIINQSIVIERSNITIDGKGYTLLVSGAGNGFYLSGIKKVTIRNTNIRSSTDGVRLFNASDNTISGNKLTKNMDAIHLILSHNNDIYGNNIANNNYGIALSGSCNNTISGNKLSNNRDAGFEIYLSSDNNTLSGNNITRNGVGISLWQEEPGTEPSGNNFHHNNFIDNTQQVATRLGIGSVGIWDDGYPSGGNYWSDYEERYPNATEIDNSGIWDTPYVIDEDNQDDYPFMKPYRWNSHDTGIKNVDVSKTVVGQDYSLHINVTMFNYGNNTENINVTVYANATIIHTFIGVTLINRTSTMLTLVWDTTGFVKGNYTMKAIADAAPGEIYTVDNTLIDGWVFVTFPGDVDGDRDVHILDIVRMVGVYYVSRPDPSYDPNCDLDDSGRIDIIDIVIAAGNYGESW